MRPVVTKSLAILWTEYASNFVLLHSDRLQLEMSKSNVNVQLLLGVAEIT